MTPVPFPSSRRPSLRFSSRAANAAIFHTVFLLAFSLVLILPVEGLSAVPTLADDVSGTVPQRDIDAVPREFSDRYKHRKPVRWGESMPGITPTLAGLLPAHGVSDASSDGARVVALTLDACGGGIDMRIAGLLRELRVPVTLFVTNRWLQGNRKAAKDLARDPLFAFAPHGARYGPASVNGRSAFGIRGTVNIPELARAAHYDDVAGEIVHELGFGIAGYTFSADAGASLPAAEVARRMTGAKHGAIILAHINHPGSGTASGLAKALPAMLKAGVRFVQLPDGAPAAPPTSLLE